MIKTVPTIYFVCKSNNFGTRLATWEYEHIWAEDGERIVKTFYELTGLHFWYKNITALVVDSHASKAGGRYRRMELTSYEYDYRARVLTHELAHRLLYGNYMGVSGRSHRFWDHYQIDLFLYDAWRQLYGLSVAKKYVQKEKTNIPDSYRKAWEKALAMSFKERQEKLHKMISRVPKKYLS